MQANTSNGRAACVVWRPRGTPVPDGLPDALARAGCHAIDADNEYEALAHLQRVRTGPSALLLVDPLQLAHLDELLTLAESHATLPVLWKFESGPSPHISAVTQPERASWAAPVPAPAQPASTPAPIPDPPVIAGKLTRQVEPTHKAKQPQPPRLRLAGVPPAPPSIEPKPASASYNGSAGTLECEGEAPAPSRGLLTDEELAMLLAPEPDKPQN